MRLGGRLPGGDPTPPPPPPPQLINIKISEYISCIHVVFSLFGDNYKCTGIETLIGTDLAIYANDLQILVIPLLCRE